jgi:speckle-type POZ protein
MLFGPMAEGITSSAIEIKDIEAKVFMALLRFIYTDSFPRMDINNNIEGDKAEVVKQVEEVESLEYIMWMQDLFVAADKYDLQRLKFICERNLCELIGVSSVASTLALAEQHYCHRLKEACFKFIQVQSPEYLDKVKETDGWKHLTTTYTSIVNEIMAKLPSSNQKGKKRKRKSRS